MRDIGRGRPKNRSGVTLTELLVCLAIVAILTGLILPAVQAVRSSASRTSCQNNLRQVGLAWQSYESGHGQVPRSLCGGGGVTPAECFSSQSRLLPYLDQGMSVDWSDNTMDLNGHPPRANQANRRLLAHKVPVLLCPADSLARDGANSYRQSIGWSVLVGGKDPLPGRLAGYGDGLSNTAVYSERLVGGEPSADRRNPLIVEAPPEQIGPACVQVQLPPAKLRPGDPYAGATWLRGADRHAQYAHLFPPNSRLQDCEVAGWVGLAIMTARSNHSGGVNVLFGDGHVQFVSDAVDLGVWRAWGTPNGGEVAG